MLFLPFVLLLLAVTDVDGCGRVQRYKMAYLGGEICDEPEPQPGPSEEECQSGKLEATGVCWKSNPGLSVCRAPSEEGGVAH